MELVLHILTNTIMPIFVLILLGAILGKTYDIHLPSLSKMYFNVLMPCFLFVNLYQAEITREMALAFLFAVLLFVLNYLVSTLVGRRLGMSREELGAFTNAASFYNSGNLGLPLITLAFSGSPLQAQALTAQIMVMLFQNTGNISLGVLNVAHSSAPDWRGLVARIIRMPSIWILPLTIAARALPVDLSQIPLLWTPAQYANSTLVGVALVTLGVQLSKNSFRVKDPGVWFAGALRLVGSPLLAWLLIQVMGFSGAVAQTLFISSAAPAAVNNALIAVEFDSSPRFAAQTVLATTALSSVTLVGAIYLARILFLCE